MNDIEEGAGGLFVPERHQHMHVFKAPEARKSVLGEPFAVKC